jgi:hypothetical protein
MIKITHIRISKSDRDRFVRFARKKGLTSSKAFSVVLRRAGI